jgi:signal transduction histidine kinase
MRIYSLKFHYVFGMCALILAVSIALLVYMRQQFRMQLENELHKRGVSIARNLADDSVKPIITENNVALQLAINDTLQNEDGVRYIYIISRQQQIIAHSFGNSLPSNFLKPDNTDKRNGKPLIQQLKSEHEVIDDISVDIQHGDFGRVHIGLSEGSLDSELRNEIKRVTPIIGLILLMGGAAAWWVASKITRPLIALSNGARQIANGHLDGTIPITSHDELADLTATFNTMTSELKKRTEAHQRTEDELRLQTTMLGEEVAERQLAQEDLAVKQYQLEALNASLESRIKATLDDLRKKDKIMLAQGRRAAMGEMINNIAHQWRQPLNNLGLIVQNLQVDYESDVMTPDTLTNDVNKMMDTIMFMSQTIDDFRSFFNSDNVKITFQIHRSLAKVMTMVEASLSKQGVQFFVEQQSETVSIEGYFNEFNQVLLNLINNAKDVLQEQAVARPVIRVSIGEENGFAVVKVWDNGGGIPDDIVDQIFDPYFTTKETGKGSGIGLYISQTIMKEHFGGIITVANINGGAQFTVSAPIVS